MCKTNKAMFHQEVIPRGSFPDFIPRTDEERIQTHLEYFETMKGRIFEVTSKDDGSSMTVYHAPSRHRRKPFRVCSRNLDLSPTAGNLQWLVARKLHLHSKLVGLNRELAFQGELVGPGINGNRDCYADYEWHVFRIWDIQQACYLEASERRELCRQLELEHVPLVDAACPVFDRFTSLEALLEFAEGQTIHGHEREGLVFKEIGTTLPVTFKVISNRYLKLCQTGVTSPGSRGDSSLMSELRGEVL